MKITEDIRKFAQERGVSESDAVALGMEEKAREFTEAGSQIYASAPKEPR
jgi:phosphomethylpyrimidine synthase